MVWTTHILNAFGHFDGSADRISGAIERARRRSEPVVGSHDLDIVVQCWPEWTIPQLGHGGSAPTTEFMYLSFDPANSQMLEHLEEPLERTIAHELHHLLRGQGPGYGTTLGEALVSEGLAGHFVREIYGSKPEPWECAVSGEAMLAEREDALREWDIAGYDHRSWFFGPSRPKWLGYSMGYALVGAYLKAHPLETAAGLVNASAERFRQSLQTLG